MSDSENEKPPLFERWSGWYVTLAVALVVQIIIYYLITASFS